MSLISYKQFQELINIALDYDPHRDRFTGQHPSAEVFTGQGSIVHSLRSKFYIQDDGGIWDNVNIIKPEFIWDMKKISANAIIDDGQANKNMHLTIHSANETDDGLYFYELDTSYASQVNATPTSGLNMENMTLNIWLRPYKNVKATQGYPFMLIGMNPTMIRLYLGIRTDPVNSERFEIRIYSVLRTSPFYILDRAITGTSAIPFEWEKLYNFQVCIQGTSFRVFANGREIHTETLTNTFQAPDSIALLCGMLYRGEISYITLSSLWGLNELQLQNMFKYKYPLPRGPEYVDLSDYFEQKGKNLLIEVGDINKAIENIRGQLYVKTNTIKLKDL